jgi:coenzyme F420 hydrogenase subunit beta
MDVAPGAPHRNLCTDCGVSRTSQPKRCASACQFIAPRYPQLEQQAHGRAAHPHSEAHFGVVKAMHQAWLQPPQPGAQWSGLATTLAQRLLEQGRVSAVLTMQPHPDDPWRPQPVLVTRAQDMAQCRGMRMGYAPLLQLLEPALAQGHTRLAVIGIPCQIYALRALQPTLNLQALYTIGTPCSDNTTTENFHQFLARIEPQPEQVTYLEFCPDYHVELRYRSGRVRRVPFLQLPLADLPDDFFPTTCRTCVDYTNRLADITVGYMGGSGQQWVLVRNARGADMLGQLGQAVQLTPPRSSGRRGGSVRGFVANTQRAAGGLPLRRMPQWLRPVVAWLMPKIGPKGLEFARARVEMKAAETVLHLRRTHAARIPRMVPAHVWQVLKPYGIKPLEAERAPTPPPPAPPA